MRLPVSVLRYARVVNVTRARFCRAVFLAGLAAVLLTLPASAQEGGLFAGFTRPGKPADDIVAGEIRFASDNEEVRRTGIGGTIYYQVLQLKGDENDPWGTGLKNFADSFKAGIDSNGVTSPPLDTQARYLYLYQVVNDRQTQTPISSVAVQLMVELKDITSWGSFTGLGFAVRGKEGDKEEGKILPVSFTHIISTGKTDRAYKPKAPAISVPQSFKLVQVPSKRGEKPADDKKNGRIVAVHWDALDPAVNPDYVMLLGKSDFDQRPSFRAIWRGDNLIKKEGRSTVFGFTSNLPPMLGTARLYGPAPAEGGIRPAATEQEPGEASRDLTADGTVPTPRPEQFTEGAGTPVPGPGAGLPPPAPALGGPPSGAGIPGAGVAGQGTGGGRGGGVAGSTGGGQSGGQATEQQTQTTTGTSGILIINTSIQHQEQHQQQSNSCCGSSSPSATVVPGPAALVLALLGLPALLLVCRRRPSTPPVADETLHLRG